MSLCQCALISMSLHPCVYTTAQWLPTVSLDLALLLSTSFSEYGCTPVGLSVSARMCLMLTPQVTQHIATCQPLSRALDNGRVILCDMIADPWVSASSSSRLMDMETPMGAAA